MVRQHLSRLSKAEEEQPMAKAWKYADDVNTDEIIAVRRLAASSACRQSRLLALAGLSSRTIRSAYFFSRSL